jgi:hypothetical protein
MFTPTARISLPDVRHVTYKQDRSLQNVTMKRGRSYQVGKAVVCAVGVAIAAMGFYQVREMIAALVIFSILFGTMGIALLMLFLIQEIALRGVTQVEARVACVRARHIPVSSQRDSDRVLRSPRWN